MTSPRTLSGRRGIVRMLSSLPLRRGPSAPLPASCNGSQGLSHGIRATEPGSCFGYDSPSRRRLMTRCATRGPRRSR
eukprot:6064612-Alexandrium_andersonii.AAC.1